MKNIFEHVVIVFALFLATSLCCCSNSEVVDEDQETAAEDTQVFAPEGMVRARSLGRTVQLKDVANEDAGVLHVRFGYEFFIGIHEVTCAEIGRDCGDSLPVTNVTFYDAVLYANARSKAEGFDTAYTFISLKFDDDSSCVLMEGLMFHPDVMAYRLPTEAEWVYVAHRDWNPEKSWHNGISGYEPHNVCSSYVGRFGICDMAGNVMEWVNDWPADIRDTTLLNFVGASDGGGLDERIVKGGSYRNAAGTMNPYSRGDIYTVTSASKAEYVGFRLAIGPIDNAVWIDKDGSVANSVITPLASSETVRDAVGTFKSKLVFRDDLDGNLAYIDYSMGTMSVVKIRDTLESYHPDVSPDGEHVTFCTGLEGVRGKSSVYVRNLDLTGSGLVRLNVENAAIPRWRVLENNDTVIVYVTDAGDNRDETSFKSASTWQVPFAKGQFGIPQKLFDGAYHGGISRDGNLAVTGARTLRAHIADTDSTVMENARDTVWYGGEQACNASLSSGGAKQTLFLDFASKLGESFSGSSYGVHERAFIVDSTGKLNSFVNAPAGFAFDHTEWVMRSDSLFVATLMDANGRHGRVVMVNSSTGEGIPLAEGQDLWHPALWVYGEDNKQEYVLDPDSAGLYFVDGKENHLLAEKMPMFWHAKDSIEIVGLGNSRMHYGINPALLNDYYMFNFGFIPCDINASFYMLMNYVLPHCENLKYVLIGIDPDMWWIEDSEWNIYQNVSYVPGFYYDINHSFWKDGIPEGFLQLVDENRRFDPDYNNFKDNRGWCPLDGDDGWKGDFDMAEIVNDTMKFDLAPVLQQNLDRLVELVNSVKDRNIKVIGIASPMCPCYRNTGAYGRYGLRRSQALEFFENLRAYDESEDDFVFMDENCMGDHDYPDDMGFDYDHINSRGAALLTSRVDSVLHTLQK